MSRGTIHHQGNRVEIHRPGIVEWYVNSPTGLEQSFTLAKRPAGRGELRLVLGLTGAAACPAGDALQLTTDAGRRLRYSGLKAIDAKGRALPARMVVAGSAGKVIHLLVDDRRALYPIVIDPLHFVGIKPPNIGRQLEARMWESWN